MFYVEKNSFTMFSAALNLAIKWAMTGDDRAKVRNHVGTLLVDCVLSDDGKGGKCVSLYATDVGKEYLARMM